MHNSEYIKKQNLPIRWLFQCKANWGVCQKSSSSFLMTTTGSPRVWMLTIHKCNTSAQHFNLWQRPEDVDNHGSSRPFVASGELSECICPLSLLLLLWLSVLLLCRRRLHHTKSSFLGITPGPFQPGESCFPCPLINSHVHALNPVLTWLVI